MYLIWVFHDRRFCQIIWQIFTQGKAKKNSSKIAPVGIETRTSGSSGQCLTNWARQESIGQEISEVSFVCFMHHFTCWTLFISRNNRAWIYKGHKDSGLQQNSEWQQWQFGIRGFTMWKPVIKCYLCEHWTRDFSHLDLMLTTLSYWGMCYLGNLRSTGYGHAILVLIKWSKSKIEVVQEQKTI